jgi:hypothetical protein
VTVKVLQRTKFPTTISSAACIDEARKDYLVRGKEHLMKALCVFLISCQMAVAQESSFFMGEFKIDVDTIFTATQALRRDRVLTLPRTPFQIFPQRGSTLQGIGKISIQSRPVRVTFSGVVLTYNQQRHRSEATSGVVTGVTGQRNVVYRLESVSILIPATSMHLTVNSAKANVTVLVPVGFMTDRVAVGLMSGQGPGGHVEYTYGTGIMLAADSALIRPDGSINGNDFHGIASFRLRKLPDSVVIAQSDAQAVNLSPPPPPPAGPLHPPQGTQLRLGFQGVRLKGVAYREGLKLFGFQGAVAQAGAWASDTLTLLSALYRTPEVGYTLSLKYGSIVYQFAAQGITFCGGAFAADVTIPPYYKDPHAPSTSFWSSCKFSNIRLRPDTSGALFDTVSVRDSLRLNSLFSVKADTAAIYFRRWASLQSPESYLGVDPSKDSLCPELQKGLRHERPGLTFTKGILFFVSPQADTLTTRYAGALTFTPSGITGNLTTANWTFVPYRRNISETEDIRIPSRATWKEITDSGDALPAAPKEKFRLASLRILEMRIMNLELCRNEMVRSAFRYTVHFPYPSFINLEFEDSTLSYSGRFSSAYGPVASQGWTFGINQGRAAGPIVTDAYRKGTLRQVVTQNPLIVDSTWTTKPPAGMTIPKRPTLPNPDTYILWAYRMPVSFAEGGVSISYSTNTAEVKIRPDPSFNIRNEYVGNELWIPRLYSKNSAAKKGVRFGGTLDSVGTFAITSFDKNPTFVRAYPKPGTERCVGLDCHLERIDLTDSLSSPAERSKDFHWCARLEFPFFAWQPVEFSVRNVVPTLTKISLPDTSRHFSVNCSGGTETLQDNPSVILRIGVRNIQYSLPSNSFSSDEVSAAENGVDLRAQSMEINCLTSAWIIMNTGGLADITIQKSQTECDTIIQRLINPSAGSDRKDLICYDTAAYRVHRDAGLPGTCCGAYFVGKFVVIESGPSKTDTTIIAPNTLYFPYASRLEMQNGDLAMKSGDQSQGDRCSMAVLPGAVMAIGPTTIDGKFQAGFAILGQQCGAEFTLHVNTECGYFHVLAAAEFPMYSFTFHGAVFVVHEPISTLESTPPLPGASAVLADVANRLLTNQDCLEQSIGIDQASIANRSTVISGVLIGGGISVDYDVIELAAAAGVCYLQYDNGGIKRQGSCFFNGEADVDLCVLEAKGTVNLGALVTSDEFMMRGGVCIGGCVSAWFAHCSCEFRTQGHFSSRDGLAFDNLDISADCGWGGCPNICEPRCIPNNALNE